MKKYLTLAVINALCIIFIPMIIYSIFTDNAPGNEAKDNSSPLLSEMTIEVFDHKTQQTRTLPFREYIIGVVAAEMPVTFHEEALSAGAAAAATLARMNIAKGVDPSLKGAVISTDHRTHQAYMTVDEMRAAWGDSFDEYYSKLCRAVDKAIDYSITYEGKLIVAAYHAISPGATENAENVWIAGFPYLVSVDSPGDELSPKYLSTCQVSYEEFHRKMTENGAVLPENTAEWISGCEYSDAGTLLKVRIGNKEFSGKQLRDIFSLRSAAITPELTENAVVMTVRGYGHGVGMSQYGADYLARQGKTWQEIIGYYYTGVTIEKLTD